MDKSSEKIRCGWCKNDPLYIDYHDKEWGVPVYNDQKLFEMLILEGAQAGLSWITVLRKRENYRKAFHGFDAKKIAKFNAEKVKQLLSNEGIIRNRLKVESTVLNAKSYLKIQEELGSFSDYLWGFVNGKPIKNSWKELKQIPAKTKESDAMSKDLKKMGFKFVGSTICYAFMQAVGMVDDHWVGCWKY